MATVVLPPGYDGTRVAHREITADVPRRAVIAGSLLWRVKQFDLLALVRAADARFAAAGAELVVIGAAPPEFEAEVLRDTKATTMVGSGRLVRRRVRRRPPRPRLGAPRRRIQAEDTRLRLPPGSDAGAVGFGDRTTARSTAHGLLEYESIDALVDGALHVLDDFETLNRAAERRLPLL